MITAAAVSLTAAVAFAAVERRSGHPMLPLEMFRSRQFASATVLALVTYAALGGVIFLFVAFLQISLRYTALQAGAATLPVTLLLLIGSGPSGAIAQRIGPRIPLTAGAVLTGAGLLLMAQIHPGDSYLAAVLPSLAVFGTGLAALITPITATVLASVDAPRRDRIRRQQRTLPPRLDDRGRGSSPCRRAFRHRLQRPSQAGSRLLGRHDHRRRGVIRGRAAGLDHDR